VEEEGEAADLSRHGVAVGAINAQQEDVAVIMVATHDSPPIHQISNIKDSKIKAGGGEVDPVPLPITIRVLTNAL